MRRAIGLIPVLLATLAAGCGGTRPPGLGVQAGTLSPCPPTPNCVSSFATDEQHGIAPLTYAADQRDLARQVLLDILAETARVEVIAAQEDYIRAEFTSLIWRFVDDVELYLPADESLIHVRSASRVGSGDLGANRKRIEELRQTLSARLAAAGS
jgi:uncharacterized protein (DUF1499 family)